MTNKSMVSVPRELPKELVEKVFMDWGGRCEYLWADFLEAIEQAGLAAPAEDVREVVEEPLGFYHPEHISRMKRGEITGFMVHSESSAGIRLPCYAHQQRKVVMPERSKGCGKAETIGHGSNAKCGQKFWGDDVHFCEGCKRRNACLDEFRQLNPEITK